MRSSFSSSSRSSPSSFSSSSCFPYSLALLAYPHVPPLVILSAAIRIIIVIIFLVLLLHIVTSTIAASTIFDMLFICLLQYPFHFGLDTTLTPLLFFSFHDRLIFFRFSSLIPGYTASLIICWCVVTMPHHHYRLTPQPPSSSSSSSSS